MLMMVAAMCYNAAAIMRNLNTKGTDRSARVDVKNLQYIVVCMCMRYFIGGKQPKPYGLLQY